MSQTRRRYKIEVFNVADGAAQVLNYTHVVEKGSRERPPLAEVEAFIRAHSAYRGSWYMVTAAMWKKVAAGDADWSDSAVSVHQGHLGGE